MDTTNNQHDGDAVAGDLLVGAARIAAFLSELIDEEVSEEDVYYAKRVGK